MLAVSSFLRRLQLSHFRSYKSLSLEVDARPVAIYGPNGSGKTNVLEALSLLSPGRGLRGAKAHTMMRRPEGLGWKLAAQLETEGQICEIETFCQPGASSRQTRIDGKAGTQTALGSLARVIWMVPAMDRLWIEGAEGRRKFLDRMVLSFDPNHGERSLIYAKAMTQRNRLLKDGLADAHWYRALEAQMAEAGAEIDAARRNVLERIARAQDGAQTAFPAAALTLMHKDYEMPATAEGFAEALARSRGKDITAGRSLTGPHRADLAAVYTAKSMPAQECSTGEQKALLISLILANARALAKDLGAPPLLLLDEVAAHLDQARRAALYDEICALKAQAWMSGTGFELFDGLGARAQFMEVCDVNGVSEVKCI
jgi:DNA replication and repair protein RecF